MPDLPRQPKATYFGHPASLRWTEAFGNGDRVPSVVEPADVATGARPRRSGCPTRGHGSAGNLDRRTRTSGAIRARSRGQQFMAELTNGMVLRTQLEEVRGEYQGAVFKFRQKLGSVCRVAFAPDHSMILGYTNRGGAAAARGSASRGCATPARRRSSCTACRCSRAASRCADRAGRAARSMRRRSSVAIPLQLLVGIRLADPEPHAAARRRRPAGQRARPDLRAARRTRARALCRAEVSGTALADGAPLLHDTFHYTRSTKCPKVRWPTCASTGSSIRPCGAARTRRAGCT